MAFEKARGSEGEKKRGQRGRPAAREKDRAAGYF